jgi:hypothetical protein
MKFETAFEMFVICEHRQTYHTCSIYTIQDACFERLCLHSAIHSDLRVYSQRWLCTEFVSVSMGARRSISKVGGWSSHTSVSSATMLIALQTVNYIEAWIPARGSSNKLTGATPRCEASLFVSSIRSNIL